MSFNVFEKMGYGHWGKVADFILKFFFPRSRIGKLFLRAIKWTISCIVVLNLLGLSDINHAYKFITSFKESARIASEGEAPYSYGTLYSEDDFLILIKSKGDCTICLPGKYGTHNLNQFKNPLKDRYYLPQSKSDIISFYTANSEDFDNDTKISVNAGTRVGKKDSLVINKSFFETGFSIYNDEPKANNLILLSRVEFEKIRIAIVTPLLLLLCFLICLIMINDISKTETI